MFIVNLNGEQIDKIAATKVAAKKWVKENVLIGPTHMGEWAKLNNGYRYATTIGRYYTFTKEKT